MKKAIHEGHRDRMRDRILNGGIDKLQNHEVLEYLLYAFVPRKDTNEIAHSLIEEFGSLAGVLNSDSEHISKVKGVTQNAAIFLSSLPDVFRMYAVDTERSRETLKGRGVAREFMRKKLYCSPREQVYMVALDAIDNLIKCEKLAVGSGDSVIVSVRKIVSFALKCEASAILIAHNHPSGSSAPSQQDFVLTRELAWTLKSIEVTLQDHYIFGNSDYYSFDEAGKLQQIIEERDITLKEGIMFYE